MGEVVETCRLREKFEPGLMFLSAKEGLLGGLLKKRSCAFFLEGKDGSIPIYYERSWVREKIGKALLLLKNRRVLKIFRRKKSREGTGKGNLYRKTLFVGLKE